MHMNMKLKQKRTVSAFFLRIVSFIEINLEISTHNCNEWLSTMA